jgi:hypothetical protein
VAWSQISPTRIVVRKVWPELLVIRTFLAHCPRPHPYDPLLSAEELLCRTKFFVSQPSFPRTISSHPWRSVTSARQHRASSLPERSREGDGLACFRYRKLSGLFCISPDLITGWTVHQAFVHLITIAISTAYYPTLLFYPSRQVPCLFDFAVFYCWA